jgi:hypothetical protein
MRRLGYTLSEALQLGFTNDDLIASAISPHDILEEKETVVQHMMKDLVSRVCVSSKDIREWYPSELFRLNFTRAELMDTYSLSASDMATEGYDQYFPGSGAAATAACAQILRPSDEADLCRIKINMKMLQT